MKKILYLLVAIIIPLLPSCKKVKQQLQSDVGIAYTKLDTLPPALFDSTMPLPAGSFVQLPIMAIPTEHDKYLLQYNIHNREVSFVGMDVLTLKLSHTFDFLDSVQVFLSAAGKPEQFVGYLNVIPQQQPVLYLKTISGLNIKDYFLSDTMYYRVVWFVHAPPPSGARFEIDPSLRLLGNAIAL